MAAIAVVIASCSAGSGTPGAGAKVTPPAIPSGAPSAASQGTAMPLAAYEEPQSQATILEAINILVTQCMRARGYEFTSAAPSAQTLAAEPDPEPYGVTSAAQAAEYGYGQPPLPSSQTSGGQRADHTAGYVSALWGITPGDPVKPGQHLTGCMPAAVDRINPSAGTLDVSLAGQLEQQAESYTAQDARVLAVERKWSACMAARGFHYQTPMDAAAAFPDKRAAGAPSQAEIATAEADVACKAKTGLPGVWLAVQAGYERELIAANQTALQALMRWQNERVLRAERVIAEQGSSR
jgi:hypothetical protein